MQPKTIPVRFDPTRDLPAWAQRDPAIVALAQRDLAYRANCWRYADSSTWRRLLTLWAHRAQERHG